MTYNLYSEREKRARQEQDPYQYDYIPEGLRNQIFHIIKDILKAVEEYADILGWPEFWDVCCKEKGMPPFGGGSGDCYMRCHDYLMKSEVEDVLDIIDITFQFAIQQNINPHISSFSHEKVTDLFAQTYINAFSDLNDYFRRASVGYQLVENRMIRMDSEYLHSEAVVPALIFLHSEIFETANEEFLSAHKHYRNGEYGACITNANKAFESVMKIICDDRGWRQGKGTAKVLVETLVQNGFFPSHLQRHFGQLADTLESGLPLVRDKDGAHGKGAEDKEPPSYMAAYALHLAATNILFLVQAFEDGGK